MTLIEKEKLDLIVNIPKNFQEKEITNDYKIRRKAVDSAVPLITNGELFIRYVEALESYQNQKWKYKSWDEY